MSENNNNNNKNNIVIREVEEDLGTSIVNQITRYSRDGEFEKAYSLIEKLKEKNAFFALYSIYSDNSLPNKIRSEALSTFKNKSTNSYLEYVNENLGEIKKDRKLRIFTLSNLEVLFLTSSFNENHIYSIIKKLNENDKFMRIYLTILEKTAYNSIFTSAFKDVIENLEEGKKEYLTTTHVLSSLRNSLKAKEEFNLRIANLSLFPFLTELGLEIELEKNEISRVREFLENSFFYLKLDQNSIYSIADKLLLNFAIAFSLSKKVEFNLNLLEFGYLSFSLGFLDVFSNKKVERYFEKIKDIETPYFLLLKSIKDDKEYLSGLYNKEFKRNNENSNIIKDLCIKYAIKYLPKHLQTEFFKNISNNEINTLSFPHYFSKGHIRGLLEEKYKNGDKIFKRMKFTR